MTVGQNLAQGADLTDRLEYTSFDDGQRLVEAECLPLSEPGDLDIGRTGESHLAPGGEHIHGVVVVGVQHHSVAAGRLAQPVHLLAQCQQLLAGLLEGVHQLRVAGRQGIDPGL